MLFIKNVFSTDFGPLSILFYSLANLLGPSSASFHDKYPSCTSLKKIGKEYLPKL